jgi:hypothetical protein
MSPGGLIPRESDPEREREQLGMGSGIDVGILSKAEPDFCFV